MTLILHKQFPAQIYIHTPGPWHMDTTKAKVNATIKRTATLTAISREFSLSALGGGGGGAPSEIEARLSS